MDVLTSFANVAITSTRSYVKPIMRNFGGNLVLTECRHPCLEVMQKDCIANSCSMNKETSRFQVITGPNVIIKLYKILY